MAPSPYWIVLSPPGEKLDTNTSFAVVKSKTPPNGWLATPKIGSTLSSNNEEAEKIRLLIRKLPVRAS